MIQIQTKKVWKKKIIQIEAKKYLKKTKKIMVKSKSKRVVKIRHLQKKVFKKKIKRIKKLKIEIFKVILILKVQLLQKE